MSKNPKNKRKISSDAIKEVGYHICPRVSVIRRIKCNNDMRGEKNKTSEELI